MIGFFNADTLNDWHTPNTIAIRIQGRGSVFFAYVEYATSRWRAGGDSPGGFTTVADPNTGRTMLRGFRTGGQVHRWSISYDPEGNDGNGSVVVTIGDERAVYHLAPEHRPDGATFHRFGLLNVMKQWDDPGEVWLDDVEVNGEREDFSSDPGWDSRGTKLLMFPAMFARGSILGIARRISLAAPPWVNWADRCFVATFAILIGWRTTVIGSSGSR